MPIEKLPSPGLMGEEVLWPFSYGRPSFLDEGNSVPLFFEKHNLLRDAGPDLGLTNKPSENVEDRRGEPPYRPSRLDMLLSDLKSGYLAYPGRRYGPYDDDIDASAKRTEELYAATPALEKLANIENWYRALDAGRGDGEYGPEAPEKIRRSYRETPLAKMLGLIRSPQLLLSGR